MAERDIALLIGVPTDFEVFCQSVPKSNWLAKYDRHDLDRENWREEMLRLWTEEYKPDVADPIGELEEFAQKHSFEVRNNATIGDLRACSEVYELIVVFAHWKGSEIEPQDLVAPDRPERYLECVAEDDSALGEWLKPKLENMIEQESGHETGFFRSLGNSMLGRKRIESVHELLSAYISLPLEEEMPSGITIIKEAEITCRARRRGRLDAIFGNLLRPGNRLELDDGLHSKEEIAAAISSKFRGTLDLTTCTSTILADYLGGITNQRFRIIQFPTVQQFAWCAECVTIALELVVQAGMPYNAARFKARSVLTEALSQVLSDRGEERR